MKIVLFLAAILLISVIPVSFSETITINTNKEQRGKGIATVLSAVLLLDCLDRGIEPHWDTGSSISYHLAEKLGYELIGPYQVLEWEPSEVDG